MLFPVTSAIWKTNFRQSLSSRLGDWDCLGTDRQEKFLNIAFLLLVSTVYTYLYIHMH